MSSYKLNLPTRPLQIRYNLTSGWNENLHRRPNYERNEAYKLGLEGGQYPIKTRDIGKNVCQAVVPLKYPAFPLEQSRCSCHAKNNFQSKEPSFPPTSRTSAERFVNDAKKGWKRSEKPPSPSLPPRWPLMPGAPISNTVLHDIWLLEAN